MSKALFITVKDLKDNSIISGSTDADKLIHFIEVAQDIHIQQYLGTKLYDKLQTLIIANTINDGGNSDYKSLRDNYIKLEDQLYEIKFYKKMEEIQKE